MKVKGTFEAVVTENGKVVKTSKGHNLITNDGLDRIKDWLIFDGYSSSAFPSIRQIDTGTSVVTSAGFSNAGNAIDPSESTYTYGTVNNGTWDNVWWKIDLGSAKTIVAIYVDWAENELEHGADYKFQYSADNVAWSDFEMRVGPPRGADVRSKLLFFVKQSPPFTLQASVRYIRLNCIVSSTTQYLTLYNLKFYEANFVAQPPMVMKIGDGTALPSGQQTGLMGGNIISQVVSSSVSPSGYIARYVMSLEDDVGNGIAFGEAGMFYCSSKELTQTVANADRMFSRGLFDPAWSKTVGQHADVYYEIEVSNL